MAAACLHTEFIGMQSRGPEGSCGTRPQKVLRTRGYLPRI